MKTLITTFLLGSIFFISQPTNAQDGVVGNGQIVKQQRNLTAFSKLAVRVGMRVRIATGNAGQAELEGESNVLEHVVTDVKNGELTIMFDPDTHIKNTKGVTVTVHVPKLSQVLVSTGCSVTSDLPIQSDNLAVTVETGSRLNTPVNTQKLTLTVRDGSQATVQGTAASANIRLSSAGKLDAAKLTIERADVRLDAASQATIHVTETLAASADGVSTIRYSGNPTVTAQEATGLSKIRRQE
ncbi:MULTISPECIES: head GIN domain-containing protein [Spirosoma]|uniref:DUF2807 domain-containing protein n=1 Tax=Spirosoma liriopis TaxID=2937440 RepID=A0ABT0HLC1_9BACT|nr:MULTISPECIES: head GIN domain-containing protein [Spirosoma]MCK8492954.1 DUF2807 domain-containing protein [Spirosoma liriopis]UHG92355.1 DUF2807 domain-containing protein [Spirosoma oryzicola]